MGGEYGYHFTALFLAPGMRQVKQADYYVLLRLRGEGNIWTHYSGKGTWTETSGNRYHGVTTLGGGDGILGLY